MKLEKDIKEISIQVKFELSKGVQLSKVLKKVNFHPLITNYLATVETSGDLKDHVRTCIKLTEQRLQYIKQSKKLMRYPAILLIFFLAIFFIDRKSTRLNSSHVAISYAVFCLKK